MFKKSTMFRILIAVAVLLSLTVGIVPAAPVAQNITYQGKLTNAAGIPLSGTYTFTFRLYNESTGGSAVDTVIQDIAVNEGLFTTILTVNPDIFDGRALWLGVKAGADPEMTPRQQILPVPYALAAKNAASGISDQILAVVLDIQANVTMINTTANTINKKLDMWAPPVRYEYFTGRMIGKDSSSQLSIITDVTNMGDTAAYVCVAEYGQISPLTSWKVFKDHCYTLNPHWAATDTPTVITNVSYARFVKINATSPYVAPQARFFDSYISNNLPSYEYLPGDFRRVEIYPS